MFATVNTKDLPNICHLLNIPLHCFLIVFKGSSHRWGEKKTKQTTPLYFKNQLQKEQHLNDAQKNIYKSKEKNKANLSDNSFRATIIFIC